MYLPNTTNWYDFWTGQLIEGGQSISADAPLDQVPLFVKAGSIVPMDKINQHTGEATADSLEIRIYKGADGSFNLYEDEGDNYNYEKGEFSVIPFDYNQQDQTLTIGDREGRYPGYIETRVFKIVVVNEDCGTGIPREQKGKIVPYNGSKTEVRL